MAQSLVGVERKELPVVERWATPRPGGPMTFSLEQILQLFAIACEKPEAYGRPISDWTARELADEGVKQGIVGHLSSACGTIDERSRFETAPVAILVESRPIRSKVKDICEVYLSAMARAQTAERTISIDEMTGIQALSVP